MSDKILRDQHEPSDSLLSKATIVLVRMFGSWTSILIHTLFFGSWIYFHPNLELLLVMVSLEAIYIGILILMAANIEAKQRDHANKRQHQRDMAIVRQDARVDEKSFQELKQIHKQIDNLYNAIKEGDQSPSNL
ncbi:DUF1003 domain-containing protein [Patescibacteria group bacterium]|nr:DUF1003 domain-containing protein [Patescibacteria group bacterium]MBU1967332.1 DUF1003 domain-containing protein [Patescibacteria group bacterium]MBU2543187.1 DUF1003 domain-containing protein [Patescibacteria group bacterium]